MIRKIFKIRNVVLIALSVVIVYCMTLLVATVATHRRLEPQIGTVRKHPRDLAIRKPTTGTTRTDSVDNRSSNGVDDLESVKLSVPTESNQVEKSEDVPVGEVKILDQDIGLVDIPKRDAVKAMMLHAWQNYVQYAWGYNELSPMKKGPHTRGVFGAYRTGASIIDSLDTLYIMNLREQYSQARDWVVHNFTMDQVKSDLSVFETTIRFVGGFLSMYSLTGDPIYKEKAKYVADQLTPAFDTPSGIPYSLVNFETGDGRNYGWASGGASILSEIGTLHLEFTYLSDVTGQPIYREMVEKIRDVLQQADKPEGFYYNYIDPYSGNWGHKEVSMGALGDSFYEYLLKSWLQSNKEDKRAIDMFESSMAPIESQMLRTSPNGLLYIPIMKFGRLGNKMEHLACFSGGLYALAASTRHTTYREKYMDIAMNITNTCHESYMRTPTGLGPEAFRFNEESEAITSYATEQAYFLRPETVESYFILWRLTHDQKYRDWGWEVVNALNYHCRTPHGFTGLKNVYDTTGEKDDAQQSFFLAETLKYLYLLFSDDSLISLDEWVFNTEAHPLPIKNVNKYYRKAVT